MPLHLGCNMTQPSILILPESFSLIEVCARFPLKLSRYVFYTFLYAPNSEKKKEREKVGRVNVYMQG